MTTMLASKVARGKLGSYPNYGLAMRFEVTVDGLSLGKWHSCKGLKVTLEYETVKQGGDYTDEIRLPGRLKYEPITLERAVTHDDSDAVQKWLTDYIEKWAEFPKYGPGVQTANAAITLLDYQLSEVRQWELRGVFPKSWSGPSLAATDNKVAIETLVLEHSGFLKV